MRTISIVKRSGGVRVVYCPSRKEKCLLRRLLRKLHRLAVCADLHNVAHGFRRGRSPVSNATKHIGYAITLSMDLKSFFDTIRPHHVPDIATEHPQCFVDGAARQGLPTSPIIANIAAAPMDAAIVALLNGRGVYTRYADDLTISTNSPQCIQECLDQLPSIIAGFGFTLNTSKTHVQYASHGRRIITGVAVDDEIHPTRALKRKLRAAKHQQKSAQAQGLAEACALREPSRHFVRRNRLRRILYTSQTRDWSPDELLKRIARAGELP